MGRVPGYLPLGKGDAGSIYWTRLEVDDTWRWMNSPCLAALGR